MKNLAEAFFVQAQLNPQMTALRFLPENLYWTFHEASNEVNAWRQGLRSQFSKGDRVLFLLKPGPELFFLLLACLAEGVIPFLVDPRLPRKHWRSSLAKANLKAIFSESTLLWIKLLIPELKYTPSFFRQGWAPFSKPLNSLKMEGDSPKALVNHESEDVSLITLTSGTTGEPKLILRNFGALFEQQKLAHKYLPPLQTDKHLAGYIVSILQSLCEKSESLFDIHRDPIRQIQNIEEFNVTRLSGPPGYIMKIVKLLKSQNRQLTQIQSVLVGGAPISRHFYLSTRDVFPNALVTIIYGATEVEPISFESNPKIGDWDNGYPVGQFLSELKVHKRAIKITFVSDAFELGLEGKHVVGDSIHWTGDILTEIGGKIFYLGRTPELIEFEGRHYACGLLEAQLEGFNGIGRIAFVQIENQVICFFEVASPLKTAQQIEVEIRSYLKTRGYNFKLQFQCVKKMPVDARHEWKIQRRELKKLYRS